MNITIAGLGHIGLPLARELLLKGHEVSGTTTSEEKRSRISTEGITATLLRSPDRPRFSADVLVVNIPPSEGQEKWFSSWDLSQVKKIIFVSSTSVRRSHPILKVEEEWVKTIGIPWLIVRPGGLLGHGRHPGKYLSGKRDIKGRLHPVNLIHHDDVVGFILTAIEADIHSETIELVSDEHHSKEEFYSEYCRRNSLPLPEFDLSDESSGEIIPNTLMKRYYTLKFPTMLGTSL